jgi:urea transport system permease protein
MRNSLHSGKRPFSLFLRFFVVLCATTWMRPAANASDSPPAVIAKAVVTEESEEQVRLVRSLAGNTDLRIRDLLTAWKEGGIFIFEAPEGIPGLAEGQKIAVVLTPEKDGEDKQGLLRLDSGEPIKDGEGKPLRGVATDIEAAETDSTLRMTMKGVLDAFALAAADPSARLRVVTEYGLAQDLTQLEALQARQAVESHPRVQRALREALCQIHLKHDDPEKRKAAARDLGQMGSLSSRDALKTLLEETPDSPENAALRAEATQALKAIASHLRWANAYGTAFRGLSTGSILLVVAIGLAITFGLMGVINMAHGELIAVGAYTAYLVQHFFGDGLTLSPFGRSISLPGLHTTGWVRDCYFVAAIPLSFLTAALVGIALERGIIRFLYRRPLESLLATWGVSLVLQQLFRLVFGANNVQVDSPSWLSGNWTVFDVLFGWNRIFVICFAAVIIAGAWAVLNKTSLGLLIRAVMQNRSMAACMGVRTERVNMLTFGLGSGLAGLAGAFLSQIGNVGPGLGQDYIVDAFMTVVVGGVGNLLGTVLSALGIGLIDQSLQQILLSPVLGKILVLGGIILFLQWRPAGLFVTKSRSLEG